MEPYLQEIGTIRLIQIIEIELSEEDYEFAVAQLLILIRCE